MAALLKKGKCKAGRMSNIVRLVKYGIFIQWNIVHSLKVIFIEIENCSSYTIK